MEKSSGAMPEIPGFRYDVGRKRYFKIQPGELKQSRNLEEEPLHPAKRMKPKSQWNSERRTGLYRYLKDIETNISQPSILAANSFLLSKGLRTCLNDTGGGNPNYKMGILPKHRRKVSGYLNQLAPAENRESLWDMDKVNTFLEVRTNHSEVVVSAHLYPIGGSRWSIDLPEAVQTKTWACNGSWLVIGSIVGRSYQVFKLRVSDIRIRGERPHLIPLRGRFSGAVAINSKGIPALAIQKRVFVLCTDPEQREPLEPSWLFDVSGKLPIDKLKYFGQRMAGSIFNGEVFVYDTGLPSSSVWRSRGGTRVVDINSCDDGKTVFVSSMLNTKMNLVCWDTRIPYARTPHVRFEGHKNSHKQLRFHVDTNYACGILAAGGDDGIVRLWDARKAELPLTAINLDGEIPEVVKLAGFGAGFMCNPCLWVQTDTSLYLYQSSQHLLH
ncbi:unnamed protein product [Agarophyton chilense]